MRNLTRLIIAALVSCPVLVSAQTPAPVDSFQIRFQSNLQTGDGVVILTPTPAASPAAKASVAPVANPPTIDKNLPIEGAQVNKPPTGPGTGTTTFRKNIPIEGSQVNKTPTSTGTFTPSKNITIENSKFQNNAAVSNTTGASSQTTTTSRVNSKRNVTDVGQGGDERSEKKKKQKQQLQEAQGEGRPVDRGGESRKKQKQEHQRQSDQTPE